MGQDDRHAGTADSSWVILVRKGWEEPADDLHDTKRVDIDVHPFETLSLSLH